MQKTETNTDIRQVNIEFLNCSEKPRTAKLDASMVLKKIRETLSRFDKDDELIMKDDMYFCYKESILVQSSEVDTYLYELLDNSNNLRIERYERPKEVSEDKIERYKLCHGLWFDRSGLRLAKKCAVRADSWSIEQSPETIPSVQLINTRTMRDAFIYEENLVLDKEDTLFNPPQSFSRCRKEGPLYDETPVKSVIFRLDKELWNINLTRDDIKPTDEFIEAIKKAIEHNTPDIALNNVFTEYGYWMNCKVKVGCRLQSFITTDSEEGDPKDVELYQTKWIRSEELSK